MTCVTTAKIARIFTRIWAATGRYRLGRPAAVVIALYLTAVAIAAVIAVVRRYPPPLSMAASPDQWAFYVWDRWPVPLLIGICGLKAWMLWQVLRGPELPRAEGLPRRVVWLRRVLYLGVAGDLVFWELLEELPVIVAMGAYQLVWGATVILLTRVVSGVSPRIRAITLALGLISAVAPPVLYFVDRPGFQLINLLGVASFGWTVMILFAQRRDGRWSRATVTIGWIALIPSPVWLLYRLDILDTWPVHDWALLRVLAVFGTVWLARTAHELARPADLPSTSRGTRLLVAFVLVLLLVPVGAEQGARLTFSGAEEGCRERIRPASDTRQQDRWRSFLCLARGEPPTEPPLFPEDLADQRILAYGEQLCTVTGTAKQRALLERVDGSTDMDRLHEALEYLCPGIVAQRRVDQAREQAKQDREAAKAERDWAARKAEINARCADPWPKLRAKRQGTSAYQLFEGGGYLVYDDRDHVEGMGGDILKAIDDGFIDAGGSAAAITTNEENAPMCLTVKAFREAPPLRLKGWDKVVEVGIASRSGRLVVPPYPEGGDSGTLKPLPNLAADGPGSYRMRVYARTFEWDEDDPDAPIEEHLIVVYPGRSTKKIVHHP